MTSFLLDTNVFLAISEETTAKLPAQIRSALNNHAGAMALSVASIWEIAIKARLGKLQIAFSLGDIGDVVSRLGIATLGVSLPHAVADVTPWPETNDPFDRLLLAQCKVEGLKLLTTDRALAAHPLSAFPAH